MPAHLLHIGYPKAGSTFLQAWFARHPELHYADGGIGGFRDAFAMARPVTTCRYFVTSVENFSMPSSTAGTPGVSWVSTATDGDDHTRVSQERVCTTLKSLFPESHVLLITRGFKSWILSCYSQYVRTGGRDSLEQMCRQIADRTHAGTLGFFDVDGLRQMYADAFGEQRLLVLPYELLRDDAAQFLRLIEQRLGLTHVELPNEAVNVSLSPTELYWYPRLSRVVAAVASTLGPLRLEQIGARYVRLTLHNRWRRPIALLSHLRPGARVTADQVSSDVLAVLRGRASSLRQLPVYQPYAEEYLWNDSTGGITLSRTNV